jgi:hypothetical protein
MTPTAVPAPDGRRRLPGTSADRSSRRAALPTALPTVLAAALLAGGLAACSGSSPAVGPSGTASGSAASGAPSVPLTGPAVADPAAGVRLRLPAGWVSVPLGNATHAALTKVVPDIAVVGELEQQIRLGQMRGLRLFAVRPHGAAKPDSLNLAVTGAPSSTLATLRAQIAVSVTRFAADAPQFATVDLPAGRALRVHYRLGDGDATTQFYVLANGQAYVLTVTTTAAAAGAASDLAVGEAVARSLQLSPAA